MKYPDYSDVPLDIIITSIAIDRTARLVTSKGTAAPITQYPTDVGQKYKYHSDTPFPYEPVRKLKVKYPTVREGLRVGRFTVLGHAVGLATGYFSVRCDCGKYEIKKWIPLQSALDNRRDMCCFRCSYYKDIQLRYTHVEQGTIDAFMHRREKRQSRRAVRKRRKEVRNLRRDELRQFVRENK